MIKDVEPLLKECEDTLTELKAMGEMNGACYVQGFINSINKLPNVEIHLGWIPVSERLPSYSERIVLATVVRRDKTWNNEPYHRLVTYSNGKWYPVPQSINLVPSHMATIEQSDGGQAEVIAWIPLPEPYREEGNEK